MNNLLDRARLGIEVNFHRRFLVLEHDGGQAFARAELRHHHVALPQGLAAHRQLDAGLARDVVDDAFQGLFLLLGLFLVERRRAVDRRQVHVDGLAAQVVGVDNAHPAREAEDDLVRQVGLGDDRHLILACLRARHAREEVREGSLLAFQLADDDLHRLAVGGEVIGVARQDAHAALADAIDLPRRHLGLPGRRARHQQFLGEDRRVGQRGGAGGGARLGGGFLILGRVLGVDGAEEAVLRQVGVGGDGARAELDDVGAVRIGDAAVEEVDVGQLVGRLVVGDHVAHAQIFFRVLVIRPGLAGRLSHLGHHHQRGLGQGISDSEIVRLDRVPLHHLRLRQEGGRDQ